MDYGKVNEERVSKLDLNGFAAGDVIMYCVRCPWQAHEPLGMSPYCPDCGRSLHVVTRCEELEEIIKRHEHEQT